MTTIKDVRNIMRPVLERRPELVLIGRRIFIKPVHHLLCGVSLGSSIDPKAFLTRKSVQLLVPNSWGYAGEGARYYEKYDLDQLRYWDITRPESMKQLVETTDAILTAFTAITTLEDYFDYLRSIEWPWLHPVELIRAEALIAVLNGDFELALNIFKKHPNLLWDYDQREPRFHQAILAGDRAEVIRILHDWEASSVKACKIERIWERTPFPLELTGPSDQGGDSAPIAKI